MRNRTDCQTRIGFPPGAMSNENLNLEYPNNRKSGKLKKQAKFASARRRKAKGGGESRGAALGRP
ncbi:hypothetical protein J19TS2_56530 [Cohnella xylanilytica]|nr:hypothetical protein J19TS2_56530 [Cohnella xylanilytica]